MPAPSPSTGSEEVAAVSSSPAVENAKNSESDNANTAENEDGDNGTNASNNSTWQVPRFFQIFYVFLLIRTVMNYQNRNQTDSSPGAVSGPNGSDLSAEAEADFHKEVQKLVAARRKEKGTTSKADDVKAELALLQSDEVKKLRETFRQKFVSNVLDPGEAYDFYVHLSRNTVVRDFRNDGGHIDVIEDAQANTSSPRLALPVLQPHLTNTDTDKNIINDQGSEESGFDIWRIFGTDSKKSDSSKKKDDDEDQIDKKWTSIPKSAVLPESSKNDNGDILLWSLKDVPYTDGSEIEMNSQVSSVKEMTNERNITVAIPLNEDYFDFDEAEERMIGTSSDANLSRSKFDKNALENYNFVYTMVPSKLRDRKILSPENIMRASLPATRVLPVKKKKKKHNLLGGKSGGYDESSDDEETKNSSSSASSSQAVHEANESESDNSSSSSNSIMANITSLLPFNSTSLLKAPEQKPHFRNKVDIRVVFDAVVHTREHLKKTPPYTDLKIYGEKYKPLVYVNDFWSLREDYTTLSNSNVKNDDKLSGEDSSETTQKLKITDSTNHNSTSDDFVVVELNHYPMGYIAYAVQSQMTMAWEAQASGGIMNPHSESFMMKKMILNNNFYFLMFSLCFMLLHTLFSFLAVKNEVQFWAANKSLKGISARSMVISWVTRFVVFLYLLDNHEDTSYLILFNVGLDFVVSTWKMNKAVKIVFPWWKKGSNAENMSDSTAKKSNSEIENSRQKSENPTEEKPLSAFWKLVNIFTDAVDSFSAKMSTYASKVVQFESRQGSEEEDTDTHDKVAIRKMSYLLYPLMVGYTFYSLFYKEHRGWYNFALKTCVGYIYLFGFIMMTPQLYINYKLKSVEHLPWRALTYRALNTFVDDIAAFLVDMPLLHRLSCLRDDVIFFGYVYQRWAYRVDKTRDRFGNKVDAVEVSSANKNDICEDSNVNDENSPATKLTDKDRQVSGLLSNASQSTRASTSTGGLESSGSAESLVSEGREGNAETESTLRRRKE